MSTNTRITRSAIAFGALGLALTAPHADAMIAPPDTPPPPITQGVSDAAQRSSGETNAGSVTVTHVGSDAAQRSSGQTNASGIIPDPAPVRTVAFADDGFDWGDAALGAGSGVLVLTLLGAGGIAVSRRNRVGLAS